MNSEQLYSENTFSNPKQFTCIFLLPNRGRVQGSRQEFVQGRIQSSI